ncbi:hypothetical protein VP01_3640g6 [Puccinia sorghi]|uniref:Amino acid transporter transmembrane domain-containing protein n=1 Tax=Puccinia sorghi TaxID=27349 RepID=A0A0L6UUS0_9BASI|nr:hypothetical protein VP01_3640g6 [Puccinia sorghi]
MDQDTHPTTPSGGSPEQSPTGYRSMIASSINLVQSYRRSQLFVGDNLPNSFRESSFNTNYLSSSQQYRLPHDGNESNDGEDDQSYVTSNERDLHHEEYDEFYDDDEDEEHDYDRNLPSSFLPPNALGSRRLPPSRAAQAGFPRQWTRQTTSSTRSHYDPDFPEDSPRMAIHNRALERTQTAESSQLINSQPSFPRYGSLPRPGEYSGTGRRFSTARSSFRRRDRLGSEAGSTAESQDNRHRPLSRVSSNHSLRLAPSAGTSTFGQTLFNAFNILCGVGLLSEPLAFSAMGWIGGVLMFIFCGLSTNYT